MRQLQRLFKGRGQLQRRTFAQIIAGLFKSGEQGGWYDPSDLTTLFQDSAGTTPVTSVEQPVGLMLDKSKGLVLGAELVANGDFSDGTTGWTNSSTGTGTATVVDGQAVLTGADPSNRGRFSSNSFATVVGRSYRVSWRVVSGTANSQVTASGNGTAFDKFGASVPGFNSGMFTALGTTTAIGVNVYGAGTVIFDNISVRELPGNHAFQATPGNRPTLSARVNLLTKTEQFDDAVWSRYGSVAVKPNVLGTLDEIVESTESTVFGYGVAQVFTFVSGTRYSISVTAKQGVGNRFFAINVAGGAPGAVFNLSTGVLESTTPGGQGSVTASIEPIGSGLYRCTLSFTHAIAFNSSQVRLMLTNSASSPNAVYQGDGVSSIICGQAQMIVTNTGVALPPYQRVNTSTDYDTVGFPLYLRFNGTSSSMATNSINFTATDKMTVWGGVRKLSDAVGGAVSEIGTNVDSINSSFALLAPGTNTSDVRFRSRGTTTVSATATGIAAPITNVLTGIGDISGDQAILRVNGTQAAISTADQGTGTYGNYPLYIGARAGTSLYFNGYLYSLIVRGAQSTTQQISSAETYVNSKTKAY